MKKTYVILGLIIVLSLAFYGGYVLSGKNNTPEPIPTPTETKQELEASYRGHWKTDQKFFEDSYGFLLIKENNEVIYNTYEVTRYGNLEFNENENSVVSFVYETGEGMIQKNNSKIQLKFENNKIKIIDADMTYNLEKYTPKEARENSDDEYLPDLAEFEGSDSAVSTKIQVSSIEKDENIYRINDKRTSDEKYFNQAILENNEKIVDVDGTEMTINEFYQKYKSNKNYFKNNNIELDILTNTFSK